MLTTFIVTKSRRVHLHNRALTDNMYILASTSATFAANMVTRGMYFSRTAMTLAQGCTDYCRAFAFSAAVTLNLTVIGLGANKVVDKCPAMQRLRVRMSVQVQPRERREAAHAKCLYVVMLTSIDGWPDLSQTNKTVCIGLI